MKRKLLLLAIMVIAIVSMLAISVSAAGYDTTRTVTIDNTTYNLYDSEGNALSYLYVDSVLTAVKSSEVFYWDGNGYLKLKDNSTKLNYVIVNLQDDTIDAGATKNCSLNQNFYNSDTSPNTTIQYVFMSDKIKQIYDNNLFRSCTQLKQCEFTENSELTTFSKFNFHNCTSLTSIYIPSGVTSFPDGESQSYGLFYNCTSLANVTFGENSKLTKIGTFVFKKTTSLQTLMLPDSVESVGQECFRESGITTWPFSENSKLTSLGLWCFFDAKSLQSAFIPKGVSDLSLNNQGYGTFYNCTSLKSVVFQSGSQLSQMKLTFKNCTSLETITFDLNCPLEALGGSTFYDCTSLKEIILPHNVKYVHNRAFQSMSADGALEVVNFGPSFESFVNDGGDTWFFYKQPKLKTLIFPDLNPDNVTAGWIQLINTSATPEIMYTGTLESWTAVLAKIKEVANNNNGTFLSITTPTIITECEAFYENAHVGEEKLVFDDKTNTLLSSASVCTVCTRCESTEVTDTKGALFTNKGYSQNGAGTIMQGFAINQELVSFYTEWLGEINYGLVAGVYSYVDGEETKYLHQTGELLSLTEGNLVAANKVATVAFDTRAEYDAFEMKVSGLTGSLASTKVFCCLYVVYGDTIYYVSNNTVTKGNAGTAISIGEIQ